MSYSLVGKGNLSTQLKRVKGLTYFSNYSVVSLQGMTFTEGTA